ncbi:MAG: hypothetical protein ACI9OJ_001776 [Myxococcota bacterium]|jgi:hypothetical protein
MHARAHPSADPIYAAILELRKTREGAAIETACAGCHSPRAAPGIAATTGVTCAACHNVAAVHAGKVGANALERATAQLLLGPHDIPAGATVAHGTGPAASHLTDGVTICGACHERLNSQHGVSMCATGQELADGGSTQTCVGCHMPIVDGPSGVMSSRKTHRRHTFGGPHRAWYQDDPEVLQRAVTLLGTLTHDALRLTLTNRTGHAFPTGFPGRQAILEIEGYDSLGTLVWRGASAGSTTPSPVIMGKRYEDAAGKPTLAPWSVRLAKDSRLKAAEARQITIARPPEVVRVVARLTFRLLPKALASKIGMAMAPEAVPKTIKELELKLPIVAAPTD